MRIVKKEIVLEFLKNFAIVLVIATILLIPMRITIETISETNLFQSEVSLMGELGSLVNSNSPFYEQFQDSERVNILLIGVNGGLTDTIIVASFDMKTKHIDMISVPRDTYYKRAGYYGAAELKINAAYKGSVINTAKAVSDVLMDIPLHYYAIVDYEGIENIVDSMGGVPIDVPFNMYYSDPTDKPPLLINIKKGYQVLDGKDAVGFIRYRTGYLQGDIGRVEAQQDFMIAAAKQALSGDILKIARTIFDNVESDITLGMATKIATKAIGMDMNNITANTIPHIADPDPPYYVYPKTTEIAELIMDIYSIEAEDVGDIDGVSQDQ